MKSRETTHSLGRSLGIVSVLLVLSAGCSGHGSSSPACDGSTCAEAGGEAGDRHDARADGGHPGGKKDAGADAGADLEALDPTVASNLAYSSAFLYTGPNAVQTGVAAGTIDITRVSVVRGQVSTHSTASNATNGLAPIEGVTVTVLGHPEFGTTKTQSDGWFSLAVNGGGLITVSLSMNGYLPVQRHVTTRWLEYAITNPVVLTAPEPGTSVKLSSSSTSFQIVRGKTHGTAPSITPTEDADGARTATLVIPPGTTASIDGLNDAAITMRATEFTTGSAGLQAMPADLPPTSAYTYAVDLSIDEANGKPVTFSQPVLFYVDNFIGFPVGDGTNPTTVPSGYYDTTAGLWTPSASGEVVKVLTNAGGTVTLDTTGAGTDTADSAFTPPLVAGERAQIASLYKAGDSFWRVGVPHFSWWDFNWGSGPPMGAISPNVSTASGGNPDDEPCLTCGSIIETENQIIAEQFPVAGTPFALRYQSDRTAGGGVFESVQIPTTGATALPSIVTGIDVVVATQGRQWAFHSDSLAPNQSVTWTWDWKDAYGRVINGHSDVQVQVGYDYQATSSYQETGQFGYWGNGASITGNRALRELTFWQYSTFPVDRIDAKTTFGFGGLSLGAQDMYDPFGETFYGGDGSRRTVDGDHFTTITTYAGGGTGQANGVPATSVDLDPKHIAMGADGTLYIANTTGIRAVDPKTQLITTFAGNGTLEDNTSGDPGSGQSATGQPVSAYGVGVGPDGSVYVTTDYTNRVRRVDPTTGIITTIAGTGEAPEVCTPGTACSDGSAATSVGLAELGGVVVGPDGCVYFAEQCGDLGRIRKIELDGTLKTVIDSLYSPDGLAFGPDGSLFAVATLSSEIVKLAPSGTLSVVAGNGRGDSGDGGPATMAEMYYPTDVAVDDQGGFYISDSHNSTLRYVDIDGVIHTLTNPNAASLTTSNAIADNGPAGSGVLFFPLGLAQGPGNALYIGDYEHDRVRVIRPPLPSFSLADAFIPSRDGSVVYEFDATGKHQHTFDALRGQTLATLSYDASGLLAKVTDDAGNVTSVDRSQAGKVVITAPFGQKTTLTLDSAGYVKSLMNPNQETVGFTYETTSGTENGLLQTLTDPKGQVHSFQYTSEGLLTQDNNPAGGQITLARSPLATGWQVQHTTKMGYASTYAVSSPLSSDWERDVTSVTGAKSTYVEGGDGSQTTTWNDIQGNPLETSVVQLGPDPRYAMIAPIAASTTTTLEPSGLALATTHTRTASVGSNILDLTSQSDVVTVNPTSSQPTTLTTTYTAGSSSNTLAIQTTTGRTVTATLDSDDRVVGIAVPGIASQAITYNTAACPAGGEGCGGRVTKVTATSASDGTRTWMSHYNYSPDTGFSSSSVDALGQTVSWTRDPVGRPLHTQLPDLTSTTAAQNQLQTTYDLNGNLSTLTVPSTASTAPTHSFPLYSQVDDLKTYTPPALSPPLATSSTSYTYNFDRQLTTIQVPDTAAYQTVNVGYDPVGRLSTVADSKSGVTSTYAYAPGGLLQSVTTSDGEVITYGFGTDGPMLMSETWSGKVAGSLAFTHDDFFRVASRSVNGGTAVSYQFDADGLYSGTSGLVASSVTRDFNGKNGLFTGSTLGSVTDALTYNGFGELKTYAATFGSTPIYSASVTARDADGRITGATETLPGTTHTWAFAYDPHGDLDSVTEDGTTTAYVFDPNGNRLSAGGQASTYDAQDRLLTSPGSTYTYSNNGDLETKVTSAGTTTYAYDLAGSLRSVALPSGDTVSYVIDGQARRVGRTWTHGGQSVTQGFLYDSQLHVAAELDGSGNVVSTFVYGTRSNVPDAMVRGGNTYRIVSDWRGSVRAVVDANAGTVVETIDYDAWGNATVNDTTCAVGAVCAAFQPFGFAGGVFDRETGLVRFGARDYDASVGRWTQKDRSRFRGGYNLYRYANNDPINYVDMTGRFAIPIPWVGGAGGLGEGLLGAASGTAAAFGLAAGSVFLAGYEAGQLYNDLNTPVVGPPMSYAVPPRTSKPNNCPTGTLPINQTPYSDDHEIIKQGVGNGPRDWTGISPDEHVITSDEDGNAVDNGPVEDYLP